MRKVIEQIVARSTSDGDGVKLLRVFGGHAPERFDPFLMLDEFGSDEASDYIGGFPPHPHRGFETVTYMLQGKMEHRDHMGNIGLIHDGDVQWMTAGKGVIHSEMPKQTEGKMRGFQLWVNLPASKKMQAARYEDIKANVIPEFNLAEAARIKAIAGEAMVNGVPVKGYSDVPDTNALYLDVKLVPGGQITLPLLDGDTVLIYVYEGKADIAGTSTASQMLSRLSDLGDVCVKNTDDVDTQFLIISGTPLKEPIVQYGPFVMNSKAEIDKAVSDYRDGILTD